MSIWYDGNDLNMYRGDSGSIIFKNLPCCEGYRVYFSVKSTKSNEIIVERSGDVSFYYIDNEGNQQYPLPGETEEEFIQRMEEGMKDGSILKRGISRIFITAEDTERLFVLKGTEKNAYYYGLKACYASSGMENTLIPKTTVDEETGKIIFEPAPFLNVYPKYVEGIQTCDCMDDIDEIAKDPKDYGIQPLLTPGDRVQITEDNVITFDEIYIGDLADVELTDLQDGDMLVYDATKKKWVNKQIKIPPTPEPIVDGGESDANPSLIVDGSNSQAVPYNTLDGGEAGN